MRWGLAVLVATVAVLAPACGGGSDSTDATAGSSTAATGAADTGAVAAAPCTKAAIAAGIQPSFGDEEIRVLDGFVCDGGWASGPVLVGPDGSEEQIEAAFLAHDVDGTWTVPEKLPCDDSSVPEHVLDRSPCRVS